ncbi:MAG: hypothetical protein JXL85_09995 [Bacilli bacterium]|nr:hypothetical protein [Bacilli bacterium]
MKQLKTILAGFNLFVVVLSLVGILYTILIYQGSIVIVPEDSHPITASSLSFSFFLVLLMQLVATYFLFKVNFEKKNIMRQILFMFFLSFPSFIYGYSVIVGSGTNNMLFPYVSYFGIWTAYIIDLSVNMGTFVLLNLIFYLFGYLSVVMKKRESKGTSE